MADRVVLVHGLGESRHRMMPLERALRADGYATLNQTYASRTLALPQIVDGLHAAIAAWALADEPINFVGHSLGGLVIRAYIHAHRPAVLGRVVLLGTPNGGSGLMDLLIRLGVQGWVGGAVSDLLSTRPPAEVVALLGRVDYPLGVIAGDFWPDMGTGWLLPRPNDGKVTIASTRVAGMHDHIVLPVGHTFMPAQRAVITQTRHFLKTGGFDRAAPLSN